MIPAALQRRYTMRLPGLAALCLWMTAMVPAVWPLWAAAGDAGDPLVDMGKRMYREGLLPWGKPIRAKVQGDVPLFGPQVACVSCHRRSGLGSTEGQILVPPVSGAWLYRAKEIGRREFYATRSEGPGTRPAYTDQTLARAIRDGMDAAGRPMDDLMPRYALADEELKPLIAYLKSLSSAADPGVTDTAIHFATLITEGADPASRKALLDVLETFFGDKNADTRYETRRTQYPAMHKEWKYRAHRKWVLHLWELAGPPQTWRAQLDDYYRRQPVFTLISGLGAGSWQPVHEFCEQAGVPCVLPNTDLPPVSEIGFYSIYFSRGLVLEAQALAEHLREEVPLGSVLQVYREDTGAAAAAFREALGARDAARLEDRRVEPGGRLAASFWFDLMQNPPVALVLWLSDSDLQEIRAIAGAVTPRIYLSSTLCHNPTEAIPQALRERVRLAHPFALADDRARSLQRVKPWMRARGIPLTDARLQLNAYYAARLVGEALMHIRGNFSRDYFIERIEHAVDRLAGPSAYPRLSLGPDQRFASKGSYIAQLSDEVDGRILPLKWIVP
jgi:mono/diheme cytochrome c family protein